MCGINGLISKTEMDFPFLVNKMNASIRKGTLKSTLKKVSYDLRSVLILLNFKLKTILKIFFLLICK